MGCLSLPSEVQAEADASDEPDDTREGAVDEGPVLVGDPEAILSGDV